MPKLRYITPDCCPAVTEHKTIYLSFLNLSDVEGQDMFAGTTPEWAIRGMEFFPSSRTPDDENAFDKRTAASFCPHCGKKLPPIVLRTLAKRIKICAVSDGGYYCDTCKERLMGCMCLPAEYRYAPGPSV